MLDSIRKLGARLLIPLLGVLVGTARGTASSASDLLASGRADESVALLEKTLGSSPNSAADYNLLCRAYYSFGDWDRGIAACEKAVSIEPGNSLYHLWLGRIYGEKADNSRFWTAASLAGKVREQFETAVRLDPNNAGARCDLSEFYVEAPGMMGGGRDKAEVQAQALEKIAPSRAHWVRARIAENKKDFATAETEYRAAIQSQDNSSAWLDLASFYRHRERLAEMEDAIHHAVAGKIDPPESLMEAGEQLAHIGRNLPLAVELLRRYIKDGPAVEEAPVFKAHYLLGTVLEKQGDKKGAAAEYSAALSLAKGFNRAKEALDRVSH
jgi:tetratricopeptide (TPR) repeat protein